MAGPGGTIGTAAWTSSALVGSSIAVILFCSHFHQIEGDLAAGKASPLTRLGLDQGLMVRSLPGHRFPGGLFS
jgi:1,4-dihydroxy-2-naphthoate octaprenyltransferase